MKRTTTILIAICVSALFANGKQISQNAALSAARKYSRTGQVAPAKNLRIIEKKYGNFGAYLLL